MALTFGVDDKIDDVCLRKLGIRKPTISIDLGDSQQVYVANMMALTIR